MSSKHQVLFVQGGGKGTHDDWDAKLVASLQRELGAAYEVRYPRMPNEDEPDYDSWKAVLERELAELRAGAVLVAHSVGGTILLRALAEQHPSRKLSALCLVASPFVGEGGWSVDDLETPRDLGARLPKGMPVHFFHGLADDTAPPEHADLYARVVPQAHVHHLAGRDHQLNDDLSEVARVIQSLVD